MKYLKEVFKVSLIVLFCIILSNLFNVRICIFYNIFHIPCPGCGTTRAAELLLRGQLYNSIKYSILPIILLALILIVSIWSLVDYKTKEKTLIEFTEKNKKILIIIAIIITIVLWIINIRNPLLY